MYKKMKLLIRNKEEFTPNSSLEHLESTMLKVLKCNSFVLPLNIRNHLKSAQLLARFISVFLKKGKGLRQIFKKIKRFQEKHSFIRGFKIACSGRIRGVEMAKTDTRRFGKTPSSVFSQKVDYHGTYIITKYGIIGIKVWICFA
jgi:small subunit ribosomal protein S3